MAKYVIEDTTLTALADSVRSAENSTDQMTTEEMAERVTEIGALIKKLVERTITNEDCNKLLVATGGAPYAFAYCNTLTDIKFPEKLDTFSNGVQHDGSVFTGCKNLKNVDMSEWKPTSVSGTLFRDTIIEELDFPETLTTMNWTCADMAKLKRVKFRGSPTKLNGAFYNDKALELVDFSEFDGDTVPIIGTDTFQNTNSTFKVLVPFSLIRAWKSTSNWAAWANQIVCDLGAGYTVTISSDLPVNEGTEIYINGIAHPLRAGDVYNGVHCVGVEGTIGLGGIYQNEWNDPIDFFPENGDRLIGDNVLIYSNFDFT